MIFMSCRNNISTNLHNLTDEIEELYLMCLDDNELLMSSEEKVEPL